MLSALKATSLTNPLGTAAASQYTALAQNYSSQSSTDVQVAMGYREKLAKLQPDNALNQLGLGYDAANSRQYPQAVTALEAYLKLAPDSQQASQVKALITQLKALSASGTVPGQ